MGTADRSRRRIQLPMVRHGYAASRGVVVTRVSVHVSTGAEGTPDEGNHTIVEIDGCWIATARRAYWTERRDTAHPDMPGSGVVDAVVTVQRGNGSAWQVYGYLFPIGWRIGAELDTLPIATTGKALARRALRRLPTTNVGT